jgi:hypothetical protein
MPSPKRPRRERTEKWQDIQQWMLWPEQELYEQIRPLVLFHQTAGERAKEIDVPKRTLSRKAQAFERDGMQSLFASKEAQYIHQRHQGQNHFTEHHIVTGCFSENALRRLFFPYL